MLGDEHVTLLPDDYSQTAPKGLQGSASQLIARRPFD
jgi:hypothetical protein